MTVGECVNTCRDSKTRRIWICPEIVKDSKIGKNYVYSGSIDSKLSPELLESPVIKHWIEESCLCIIYKVTKELFIFAISS